MIRGDAAFPNEKCTASCAANDFQNTGAACLSKCTSGQRSADLSLLIFCVPHKITFLRGIRMIRKKSPLDRRAFRARGSGKDCARMGGYREPVGGSPVRADYTIIGRGMSSGEQKSAAGRPTGDFFRDRSVHFCPKVSHSFHRVFGTRLLTVPKDRDTIGANKGTEKGPPSHPHGLRMRETPSFPCRIKLCSPL